MEHMAVGNVSILLGESATHYQNLQLNLTSPKIMEPLGYWLILKL